LSAHFVPYGQTIGIPNVIVDGTANIGTVLTLSHWRRSGTPEELASDTSAEIVFKYLDSPHLHVTAEAVSNDHFDENGLIGVFARVHFSFRATLDVAHFNRTGTECRNQCARAITHAEARSSNR
jgi:hypothetical protein